MNVDLETVWNGRAGDYLLVPRLPPPAVPTPRKVVPLPAAIQTTLDALDAAVLAALPSDGWVRLAVLQAKTQASRTRVKGACDRLVAAGRIAAQAQRGPQGSPTVAYRLITQAARQTAGSSGGRPAYAYRLRRVEA